MEFRCTYGSSRYPATLYTYDGWYVIDGSVNVNRTHAEFYDGIDVETIEDYDAFTWDIGIESVAELIEAVEA